MNTELALSSGETDTNIRTVTQQVHKATNNDRTEDVQILIFTFYEIQLYRKCCVYRRIAVV
jgi:hypothetical protein